MNLKYNMIVIDLETTGTDPKKHQILSIGAVDFTNNETFYGECRMSNWNEVTPEALTINGFTREQIYDPNKPTELKLYSDFLEWALPRSCFLAGHNVGSFDVQFLKSIHKDHGGDWSFGYHYLDLHSVYYAKFNKSLSLKKICLALGVEPEPKVHNALTGALKAAECFRILLQN